MIPSTPKQRQLIAIGCSRVGIDADLRHAMLLERFGVDSSTKLSLYQADKFLDELRQKGFQMRGKRPTRRNHRKPRPTRRVPRSGSNVVRMAKQEEHEKIAALAGLITWKFADGQRWMKARLGIEKVRTAYDAWLVIEALKKMFENRMLKEHGWDWWGKDFSDQPEIAFYIMEHRPIGS